MDDSAIVELFWKRDEQAIAATTEKYNVCLLYTSPSPRDTR